MPSHDRWYASVVVLLQDLIDDIGHDSLRFFGFEITSRRSCRSRPPGNQKNAHSRLECMMARKALVHFGDERFGGNDGFSMTVSAVLWG